jgi:hypothetical protein
MNDAADIQSAAVARPLYMAGTLRPATKYCASSEVRHRKPMPAYRPTVESRNPAPIHVRGRPRSSARAMSRIRPPKASRKRP